MPFTYFQAKFENIMAVVKAVPTLMGKPFPSESLSELAKMEKMEVPYTPYQEEWNIHRLPDGNKIKIRLLVSAIYRIKGRYDELGYPIYLVNSTNTVTSVPKP